MRSLSARLILATALIGAAGACTPTIDARGNLPSAERLAEIKPGSFTKSDIQSLLGTPSNTSPFGDDTWYYISSKIETFAFFKPEELERLVVAIDFDKTGKVTSIRKLGLAEGRDLQIATRETPTAGQELSLLQQLLGNVGKFSGGAPKGAPGGGNGPGG